MKMKLLLKLACIMLLVGGFSTINAQNLVTNGEFDTGPTDTSTTATDTAITAVDVNFYTYDVGQINVTHDQTGKLSGPNSMLVEIVNSGYAEGYVRIEAPNLNMPAGDYIVSFQYDCGADVIAFKPVIDTSGSWEYGWEDVSTQTLTGTGTYADTFNLNLDNPNALLRIFLGVQWGIWNDGKSFYFDNLVIRPYPWDQTDITSFSFSEETGAATIDTSAHTVDIEVVYGTDVSSIIPTIVTAAGASVSPASGVAQDFSSPVTYTVTAEDGVTTQDWTVTVTVDVSVSTETDITAFSLPEQLSAATIDTSAHTVSVEVVSGTDVTALTPTIEVSAGATIDPASGVAQDFTNDVTYTVTAQDGTTIQDWTVSVTVFVPESTETDITSFSLTEQTGPATIDTSTHTVSIEVANGTDVTALTPTIGISTGATIDPASGAARNFIRTLTYTVTAEDVTVKQDWSVTVTVEEGSGIAQNNLSNVNIYPNPASEAVNIDLSMLTGDISVSVVNISGVKVFEQNNITESLLTISNLESGLYLVYIENNGNTPVYKLIVE